MRRRIISVALATIFLATNFTAQAQQPGKVAKIGLLGAGFASAPWRESFLREFQKLGYVDGKNATFIHRFADTKYDRLPALADELVRFKVDVIITPGANDTGAAKERDQDDTDRFSERSVRSCFAWVG